MVSKKGAPSGSGGGRAMEERGVAFSFLRFLGKRFKVDLVSILTIYFQKIAATPYANFSCSKHMFDCTEASLF